jgi:aspartyl-tRNA(Asn)/glutamyl-tRNA(Gln) amidotransferase subunit C
MNKEEFAYLEGLAKVTIAEDKREQYAKEISDILAYVKEVQDVDTSSVNGTVVVDGTPHDVYKGDEIVSDSKHRDKALANAPATQNGYYKVSQVIKQ